MVRVGFWQPDDTKQAPSITNTFGHVVQLVVGIDHRGLRVEAHASGAEFVDRHTRHGEARVDGDALGTRGFDHLGGCRGGVLHHVALVVAVGHGDAQRWNAPGVFQLRVDDDEVVVARERFAERPERDVVDAVPHGFLVADAEALGAEVEARTRFALVAVAAEEARVPLCLVDVAEADEVDAVRAMRAGHRGPRVVVRQFAIGARADAMVHEAASQ